MRKDSSLDKHYLRERDKKKGVGKKERAYSKGGWVHFPKILKSKACLRVQLQTHTSTCPRAPCSTRSLAEPCVFIQLPSTARCKQETGVEVGVRSMINASVSQQEGVRGRGRRSGRTEKER